VLLEELGVPYELHAISLSKNEQKEDWFLKINPNGRIPAMTDGDVRVFESGALVACRVLAGCIFCWRVQGSYGTRVAAAAAGVLTQGKTRARRHDAVPGAEAPRSRSVLAGMVNGYAHAKVQLVVAAFSALRLQAS